MLVTGPVVVKTQDRKYTGNKDADLLLAEQQIEALMGKLDNKEKESSGSIFHGTIRRKKANPPPPKGAAFPGIRHHSIVDPELEQEKPKKEQKGGSTLAPPQQSTPKRTKKSDGNKAKGSGIADMLSPRSKPRKPKNRDRQTLEEIEELPPPAELAEPEETEQEREERRERQYQEFMKEEEPEEKEEEIAVDEEEEDILLNFSLNSCEIKGRADLPFSFSDNPEKVVVVDNGSFYLRAGLNSNDKPELSVRNTVNLDKESEEGILNNFISAQQSNNFYDSKCKARVKLFDRFYSVDAHGNISDWENQETVWDHMYETLSDIDSTPVLLSELSGVPASEREKKAEIFFEKYQVPAYCSIPDCVLSLYGCGLTSGLVVDCGRGTTRITPVYNGMVLRGSQQNITLNIGATHLADYLQSLLVQVDGGAKSFPSNECDRYLREKCYFPRDFGDEFKRVEEASSTLKRYNLLEIPGVKKPVDMAKIRFHATYPLFKPSLFGSVDLALPRAIQTAVSNVSNEEDFQSLLYKNIVLSGGTSSIHGFHSLLQNSLQTLCPEEEIHIMAQSDRVLNTWRGGQIVSQLDSFPKMLIKNEEFQEVGPKIVNWMCPY